MATPNYNYEKRQRELAKKKKKEEKLKERESRKVEGDVPAEGERTSHVQDAAATTVLPVTTNHSPS
jgi:hypothetical protein